ncbi:MAG: DUF3421 domain-containing protein [Pseudobacteriovorax sp.]|nr:DUF3421 domain-containing protein [Pseudobacteriovorax sp.]
MTLKRTHSWPPRALLFMWIIWGGPACTKPKNNGAPPNEPQDQSAVDILIPPEDSQSDDVVAIEPPEVILPELFSQIYLACGPATVANGGLQASLFCSIRNRQTSNSMIPSMTHTWTFVGDPDVLATFTPSANMDWSIAVNLSSDDAAKITNSLANGRILATFRDEGGNRFVGVTVPSIQPYYWQAANGTLNTNDALVSGSQHEGTVNLYSCRAFHSNAIIPGKLSVHFNNANASVCFTTINDQVFASQSEDGNTLVHNSDILKVRENGFVAWSPLTDKLPDNAIITGRAINNDPLYTCRNLERGPPPAGQPINDPNGEQTPGFVGPNSGGCIHEYYGANTEANYAALVWTGTCNQGFAINPNAETLANLEPVTCSPLVVTE